MVVWAERETRTMRAAVSFRKQSRRLCYLPVLIFDKAACASRFGCNPSAFMSQTDDRGTEELRFVAET